VSKVLLVIVENHSLGEMHTGMPYTFGLARTYGYADSFFAIRHPSLPNYVAIAGGSTYGIVDDADPSSHPIHGPSVFGRALATGHSAGVYADGMATPCATGGGDGYAVRHNPWTYFVDERRACQQYDVPYTAFPAAVAAGRLPDVGMVVPNLCHDAHDCPMGTADAWFKGVMEKVFAGPDWRSGRLAVVLTADEDDGGSGNRVLTVVIHRSQHGHVVHTRLDHYSLSGLLSRVTGTVPLAEARQAPSMAAAFGLPLRG
jgi:acid phosphatase